MRENICSMCEAPCKECEGDSRTCTSCVSDGDFPNLFKDQCIQACPMGYKSVRGECNYECEDPNCEICDSENVCQSCVPGLYNFEGDCVVGCPKDFKPNDQYTACIPDDDDGDNDDDGSDEGIISRIFELFGLADAAEKMSALYLGLMMTLSLTYFV